MDTSAYLEKFQHLVKMIEECGGVLGYGSQAISAELPYSETLDSTTEDMVEDAMSLAKDKYLAAAFLYGSDINRYGTLQERLQNDYLMGDKLCYPDTLTDCYNLLLNW